MDHLKQLRGLVFALLPGVVFLLLFSTTARAEDSQTTKPLAASPEDIPPYASNNTTIPEPIPACPLPPSTTYKDADGTETYYYGSSDEYCDLIDEGHSAVRVYCFLNPSKSATATTAEYKDSKGVWLGNDYEGIDGWRAFRNELLSLGESHTDACYICGCFRGDHENGGNGCFPPGVKITMADGSLKEIEKIKGNEQVWNPVLKRSVAVNRVIEGPEALPIIRFGFGETVVRTSQDHPVLTEKGLKPAKELSVSDRIYDQKGALHPIERIEQLPTEEGQRVINLSLAVEGDNPDERMILSDGIITGDIVLQDKLKAAKISNPSN